MFSFASSFSFSCQPFRPFLLALLSLQRLLKSLRHDENDSGSSSSGWDGMRQLLATFLVVTRQQAQHSEDCKVVEGYLRHTFIHETLKSLFFFFCSLLVLQLLNLISRHTNLSCSSCFPSSSHATTVPSCLCSLPTAAFSFYRAKGG